jgi:translocation protein SEC63
LKIDDSSALPADEYVDDSISDPEDSLAHQMAVLRGGAIKKPMMDSDDEDESTTDGELSNITTDSDSD